MKLAECSLAVFIVCILSVFQKCETSGNCLRIVKYIYHSLGIRSDASVSPRIVGEWTSSSCEVRPGPQFFTRYIKILRNATWEGYFHRYNDSDCSQPKFSLHMHGFYKVYDEALPSIKGSNKAFFNFTRLDLYPHNEYEQERVINASIRHCPNTVRVVRSIGSRDLLEVDTRAFRKRACRNTFGFLESEFYALKLETRKKKGSEYDQLFFAEIPTIKVTRKYMPKSYQLPLQRFNAHNCTNCMKIRFGTGPRPPKLPQQRPPIPVRLDGQWASSTCESIPSGRFLTRHFKFISASLSWEAHYYFYLDSDCKTLDFELIGKGQFVGGIPSRVVPGAYEYVFTMTKAAMTPYDPVTTRLLNTLAPNLCGEKQWVTGKTQDITPTKGCGMYGIYLPHTEYDLLKMGNSSQGRRLLYVGQRSTDLSAPNSPSKRATSFQVPLVECSSFKFKFVPPTTRPATRTTTRFGKRPGSPILQITIPTLRRKEINTTRRVDQETTAKTTNKKNINKDESTFTVSKIVKEADFSCAIHWPSSWKPLLLLSIATVLSAW